MVHLEALLTSVLVKNNFPFTAAPVIIDLCKEMSSDPKALDIFSMSRTTASYKGIEGHGVVNHKKADKRPNGVNVLNQFR